MNDWTLPGLLGKFRSEAACRAWFEAARWPDGVRCPRCSSEIVHRLSTRPSQFNCRDCRYRFSVTSGTPLHGTHLPLRIWLLAMYLMATSTHGISARRLSLWLGIGYRSAWHLAHRIRALMAADPLLGKRLAGIVEADETYIGGKPRKRNGGPRPRRGRISGRGNGKPCVLVAVERGGRVRMERVASHGATALGSRLTTWVDGSATLVTDELPAYRRIGRSFGVHLAVRHSADEFARTDPKTGLRVHNNTAESVHAGLKTSIRSVFHHVSPKHLSRYLAEIAYRWNRRRVSAEERLLGLLAGMATGPLTFAECVR